jgi:hypothetical protein
VWYDQAEKGWIIASAVCFSACYVRGYKTAAWVVPLTVTAFCLGLFLGIDSAARGKFKLPVATVAQQIAPIYRDYCSADAAAERCQFLQSLMR